MATKLRFRKTHYTRRTYAEVVRRTESFLADLNDAFNGGDGGREGGGGGGTALLGGGEVGD